MHQFLPLSLSLLLPPVFIIAFLPPSYTWTTTISLQTYIPLPLRSTNRAGSESLLTSEEGENGPDHPIRSTIWSDGPYPGFPFSLAGPNDPAPGPPPALLLTSLCTEIEPDRCCGAVYFAADIPFHGAFQATFANLEPRMIAEVWEAGPGTTKGECKHLLEENEGAPPWWTWRDTAVPPAISGASYTRCPADPITTGGSPVFAALCSSLRSGLSTFSGISSRGERGRRRRRRWSRSRSRRGDDGASSSDPGVHVHKVLKKRRWAYPDIIVVNGTNYTDGRRGDLIYRDGRGNVLDLTRW